MPRLMIDKKLTGYAGVTVIVPPPQTFWQWLLELVGLA